MGVGRLLLHRGIEADRTEWSDLMQAKSVTSGGCDNKQQEEWQEQTAEAPALKVPTVPAFPSSAVGPAKLRCCVCVCVYLPKSRLPTGHVVYRGGGRQCPLSVPRSTHARKWDADFNQSWQKESSDDWEVLSGGQCKSRSELKDKAVVVGLGEKTCSEMCLQCRNTSVVGICQEKRVYLAGTHGLVLSF
jgi:hypothetical protein